MWLSFGRQKWALGVCGRNDKRHELTRKGSGSQGGVRMEQIAEIWKHFESLKWVEFFSMWPPRDCCCLSCFLVPFLNFFYQPLPLASVRRGCPMIWETKRHTGNPHTMWGENAKSWFDFLFHFIYYIQTIYNLYIYIIEKLGLCLHIDINLHFILSLVTSSARNCTWRVGLTWSIRKQGTPHIILVIFSIGWWCGTTGCGSKTRSKWT